MTQVCLSLSLSLGSAKHGENKVPGECFRAHFCPLGSSQPLRGSVLCLDPVGHSPACDYGYRRGITSAQRADCGQAFHGVCNGRTTSRAGSRAGTSCFSTPLAEANVLSVDPACIPPNFQIIPYFIKMSSLVPCCYLCLAIHYTYTCRSHVLKTHVGGNHDTQLIAAME